MNPWKSWIWALCKGLFSSDAREGEPLSISFVSILGLEKSADSFRFRNGVLKLEIWKGNGYLSTEVHFVEELTNNSYNQGQQFLPNQNKEKRFWIYVKSEILFLCKQSPRDSRDLIFVNKEWLIWFWSYLHEQRHWFSCVISFSLVDVFAELLPCFPISNLRVPWKCWWLRYPSCHWQSQLRACGPPQLFLKKSSSFCFFFFFTEKAPYFHDT